MVEHRLISLKRQFSAKSKIGYRFLTSNDICPFKLLESELLETSEMYAIMELDCNSFDFSKWGEK